MLNPDLKMVNGTREILKNLPHYFPEYADPQGSPRAVQA